MPTPFLSWIAAFAVAQIHLPGTSSVSVAMIPPVVCKTCHAGFADTAAWTSWAGSAMSLAAKDPLFLSAVTEAEKDYPGVGDYCLRCHAPEAWVQGRCFPTDGSGLQSDDTGVTCSTCHRMDPSPWLRNGQYLIGDDLEMRGPIPDAQAPHRTRTSTFTGSSELCGACHDLRNPLVFRRNLDGTPTNQPFPEQTTYTEWKTSAFATEGKSCASCHLPKMPGEVAFGGPERQRSSHELAGGNLFLLGAIGFLEPGLGIEDELELGKLRIRATMRTAASLELVDPAQVLRRGEVAQVRLRVTNLTGHKLPTGYPEGRRVWLQVESPVLGLDRGDYDATTKEPIDPAALYHTVQGQLGVGPSIRLVLNDAIFFDNRIPPRGFVPTATTAPVGKQYPEVSPGVLAHWDDVTVTATVPCDPAITTATLQATLWHQSVTKRYVDQLVAENGAHPRGQRLQLAFDEADPGPLEVTRLTVSLPIDERSSCAAPDAGFPDLGMTDATNADTGGPAQDAGVVIDAGSPVEEEGGCSCRSESSRPRAGGLIGALLLCLLGLGVRSRKGKLR